MKQSEIAMSHMKGWMYILLCADGSYYTGSTKNLMRRLAQHQDGVGARHTSMRLPVELVYWEEYHRIDLAFYREKQVQRWSRKKKEALIQGNVVELKRLAECRNETHWFRLRSTTHGFAKPPYAHLPVRVSGTTLGLDLIED